jgi:hypothetical protein
MADDALDDLAIMLPTSAEPPNGQYAVDLEYMYGRHLNAWYPNSWGASVVIGTFSYGGREGLYELAVLHGEDLDHSSLCYGSPITGDVVGYLTAEEVVVYLHRIARLPVDSQCAHGRQAYDDWIGGMDLAGGSDRTVILQNDPEAGK